ncbi:MAG: hypothetical protein ACRDOJ_10960 [Nocardioidaceae bacterium]
MSAPAAVTEMSWPSSTRLEASVRHADGMLGRLAAVLITHPVSRFDYRVQGPTATLTVVVEDTGWHAQRVAARLRRVVGVLDVT